MRAGSAPRAPRWGRSTPPNPLQWRIAARTIHRHMLTICRDLDQHTAAQHCPEPCASDLHITTTSNRGSQGQRPGPGVQGARSPLAAARVGHLHYKRAQLLSTGGECPAAARVGHLHCKRTQLLSTGGGCPAAERGRPLPPPAQGTCTASAQLLSTGGGYPLPPAAQATSTQRQNDLAARCASESISIQLRKSAGCRTPI
jgi:hypothetical protein